MQPFLKWVGSKRKLAKTIASKIPARYDWYFEVFLGSGAVFFELLPKKAVLSDTNLELINCYIQLRDRPEASIGMLREFAIGYQANLRSGSAKTYYYHIRNLDRDRRGRWLLLTPEYRAARFIFLNKTAYSGMWRVNRKNEMNVPFGNYQQPNICDLDRLWRCSEALQGKVIRHASYDTVVPYMTPQDVAYVDPPYVATSDTANFTGYSDSAFTLSSQSKLADCLDTLTQQGKRWVASNSNTAWVRDRYSQYCITEVERSGAINCKPNLRSPVSELIINNKKLPE